MFKFIMLVSIHLFQLINNSFANSDSSSFRTKKQNLKLKDISRIFSVFFLKYRRFSEDFSSSFVTKGRNKNKFKRHSKRKKIHYDF